jgi:hypothetical protein
VCREIGEEVLPVFHSANKFHLEKDNFSFKNTPAAQQTLRSPIQWWRAMGDANLRSIRELKILGQCMYGPTSSGMIVKYRRPRGSAEILKISYVPAHFHLEAEVQKRMQKRKQIQREDLLAPMLRVLTKDGPHMRVLKT